jgi:hypothetical protein
MARRPIEQKKRRRVAKALRRDRLPAFFSLVDWLVDHKHAKTRREARGLLAAGRVKANSHPLGGKVPTLADGKTPMTKGWFPVAPVEVRKDIVVSSR